MLGSLPNYLQQVLSTLNTQHSTHHPMIFLAPPPSLPTSTATSLLSFAAALISLRLSSFRYSSFTAAQLLQ